MRKLSAEMLVVGVDFVKRLKVSTLLLSINAVFTGGTALAVFNGAACRLFEFLDGCNVGILLLRGFILVELFSFEDG